MKTKILIVISIFTLQISFAQTAADYYLPLCVGNYLKFYTPDNGFNPGWEARNTFHSIVQADSINGEIFYLQKGYEVMDYNQSINVFHYFWLRQDVNGEILIGAYDLTGNGTIDSALIAPPGSVFFSNQFLILGFSQTQSFGTATYTDSVISISATVGTYTHCIQIRHTRKTNGIIDMMEDDYHAYHMGIVKQERFIPTTQVHVNSLIDFVVTNCNATGISSGFENKKELSIYPNPASDNFTFAFDNVNTKPIILTIYSVIGDLISSETLLPNQSQINIENLSNGIYIIEIKSENWTEKQKLIIQR